MTITRIAASAEGMRGIADIRSWLAEQPPADTMPLAERRARHDAFAAAATPVEDVTVAVSQLGGVRTLRVAPPDPRGDCLFVHGGAYVLGSPESHLPLVARYALATGMTMHAVAYRLAPEHPYPAAVDDIVAAFRALRGAVPMLGSSAGGGLALAATLVMRDGGLRQPSNLVLLAPWIDLSLSGASVDRHASLDQMLTRSGLSRDADAYRGPLPASDPRVSPLFADLAGLPPILVQVGGDEVLLDDTLRLEAAVAAVGGQCHVELWDGMTHSWIAFGHRVPEAERAIDAVATQLVRSRGAHPPA